MKTSKKDREKYFKPGGNEISTDKENKINLMMEKYPVVLEKAENNYSAFSPDVWGCIATGETVEETKCIMEEVLQFHIEGLIEAGENVPSAKGISRHIADGVFRPGEIAGEYYITEVEIPISQHA